MYFDIKYSNKSLEGLTCAFLVMSYPERETPSFEGDAILWVS